MRNIYASVLILIGIATSAHADTKPDYYAVLGIQRSANEREIKAAYRKLAMAHHPDRGGNLKRFQEIQEAYDALEDAQKRAAYDQASQPSPRSSSSNGRSQVISTNAWLRQFAAMRSKALTGENRAYFAAHPLTLFYTTVMRAPYGFWGDEKERRGLHAWYYTEEHRLAVQAELYAIGEANNWPNVDLLEEFSRPAAISILLRENSTAKEIEFAHELILSADGADFDTERMAEFALELQANNYYGNRALEEAVRQPLRDYFKSRFPDRRHASLPGWSRAMRFLKLSSTPRRIFTRCMEALTSPSKS